MIKNGWYERSGHIVSELIPEGPLTLFSDYRMYNGFLPGFTPDGLYVADILDARSHWFSSYFSGATPRQFHLVCYLDDLSSFTDTVSFGRVV